MTKPADPAEPCTPLEHPQETHLYPGLAQRLHAFQQEIRAAEKTAGRREGTVQLITVTKFHDASLIRALQTLGIKDFGENRQQELTAKAEQLQATSAHWHFIGQLQSKKAARVANVAHSVHSLDRETLIAPLAKGAGDKKLDVFLQINLTDDAGRGGCNPKNIENLTEKILESTALNLQGVMAVAPLESPAEKAFARLAEYSARVRKLTPQATAISAGMSHDFREAIAAGATHLRIGTAITGKRPATGNL